MNIELQHHDAQALAGVARIREQWKEMFLSRLNPKRYKVTQEDEQLLETLSDILTTEGQFLFETNLSLLFV